MPRPPAPPAPPARRAVLRSALGLSLAAAAAPLLSGCGTAVGQALTGSAQPADSLTFWNLFGGGDGLRMQQMEQSYQHSHPSVRLEATTLAWGNPYYTKLTLATLGGRPPQVAVTHLSRLPTLAAAGLLTPLDPAALRRHRIAPADFDPRAYQQASYHGALYALPLDTHPFVLYYNTEVCRKAGLLDADGKLRPIQGTEAFTAALRAGKQAAGGFGAVMSITGDTSMCWRWWWSCYRQLGGEALAGNGTRVVLDRGLAARAAAYLQELTAQGLMPGRLDAGGAMSLFTTGKAAFLLDGEWDVTTVQTTRIPFGMVPLPRLFTAAPYAVWADSHALVLPRAANMKGTRLDTALEFVRSLLATSYDWAQGGHIPAWLPTRESAAYRALKPQSDYASATRGAAYDPPAWYSGAGSDLESTCGDLVGQLLAGALSPAAFADRLHGQLAALASRPSPL